MAASSPQYGSFEDADVREGSVALVAADTALIAAISPPSTALVLTGTAATDEPLDPVAALEQKMAACTAAADARLKQQQKEQRQLEAKQRLTDKAIWAG